MSAVGYVDDIDVQIEKIHKLIEGGARIDPELAAGLATTESLGSVQRKLDRACAAAEEFAGYVKDARRKAEAAAASGAKRPSSRRASAAS
jgi:hypothetical protein